MEPIRLLSRKGITNNIPIIYKLFAIAFCEISTNGKQVLSNAFVDSEIETAIMKDRIKDLHIAI